MYIKKHPSRFVFWFFFFDPPKMLHNQRLQRGTHQRELAVFHTAVHSEHGIVVRLEKFNKLMLLST